MTTMHTEWTDRLSEYLDNELTADERRAVEAHLASCADCTAVLNDLKQVVARAKTLEPRPPANDLWPGIAARGTGVRAAERTPVPFLAPRRVSFTVPQALAASLAVALLSGALVWQIVGRQGVPPAAQGVSPALDTPRADVATVSYADAQYDAAVADLEKALKDGRGRLDQSTIAIVERNLQIIDQAIDQARQALDADPANSYLSSHLVEARRRKLDLLRRATALAEGD